ncbi:DMT family transporter [Candidatus Gottesmanbacteria bacterium]|nr:DMT family transporter [Candidatus Gottesmanbacteria bacterium]
MAVFFALLTLIGWGVGDIFGTVAIRRIGSIAANFWWSLLGLIFASLYIPFAGGISDYKYFIFAVLIATFNIFGNFFFYKGLQFGNASLNGTITGSYILVTVLIAIIFLKEILTSWQFLGIIFILIGIILGSLNFSQIKKMKIREVFSDKGVKFSFLTMILWGIYFAVIRIPAEQIGWFWAGYPIYFLGTIIMFFLLLPNKLSSIRMGRKISLMMLLFVVFTVSANFFYNLGILQGFTSIVAPIAGSYPVLFVLLLCLVFKEKLSRQQSLGIVSSLLGIVLVSLTS